MLVVKESCAEASRPIPDIVLLDVAVALNKRIWLVTNELKTLSDNFGCNGRLVHGTPITRVGLVQKLHARIYLYGMHTTAIAS